MSLYTLLAASQASQAAGEAARAAGEARRLVGSAAELEQRLDRTVLALEALWSLASQRLGITEEELVARMNDIDLTDGRLDGKASKGAVSCPKCSRTISRRLPKCIYCGQAIVHDPFV